MENKTKILIGIGMVLIVAIAAAVWFGGYFEEKPVADGTAKHEDVSSVVSANNKFSLELYSKLSEGDGNVFFSPYSISTALAMTYEGARGQTAQEMQKVFHFPENDSARRLAFAEICKQINKKDKKYELHTANALWAQKDYRFLDSYFGTVEKYYKGKVTNLDFVMKTEESRLTINRWGEEQTNNRIKDLIPPGGIDAYTRLVITNAVYFKGKWAIQFDKKYTYDSDFHTSPKKTVKVPMMHMGGEKFDYTENEDLQMLEMDYEGGDLSMLILLPKDNITSLERALTPEMLAELKANLSKQEVDVSIPKFSFTKETPMTSTLIGMGMPTAFNWPGADFSGMDGTKNLFITDVFHKAFVEVNEEGTEAAAATAVIMTLGAAMPENIFQADHPFVFMIQQKQTGNILFMGRVVDPSNGT